MNEKEATYFAALDRDILAIQLLEVSVVLINRIRKYAEENGIALEESPSLDLLLARARNLISEMDKTNAIIPSDEFLQRKKSDKDFTESDRTLSLHQRPTVARTYKRNNMARMCVPRFPFS